jgi:hypothetical protein
VSAKARWAIVAIVVVAVAIAGVGFYASRQPSSVVPYCATSAASLFGLPSTSLQCAMYNGPVASGGPSVYNYTGPATVTNTAFLSPGHAVWWYVAAGAVLVVGLLGIWAASASSGKRAENT